MQIKKRHSLNPDLQFKNLNGQHKSVCKSQHTIIVKDPQSSPLKIVRKQGRQASSFVCSSQSLHFINNPTYQLIQQCITTVEMIKEKYKIKTGNKFFHIRSCSMPCQRVQSINNLLDYLIDDNKVSNKQEQRNLEEEIQSVMNQLIEEKKQKQKAYSQGESLHKQQEHLIQYLKSRIEQYKQYS